MNAGELRSGCVATANSFNDSSIRPSPMATRPRWRGLSSSVDRNAMTPAPINSGETQPRSNERIWAAIVVPTSAPSMTARAIDSGISPRAAKEETNSEVAVLDCSRPVTAMPPAKAVMRLREQVAMARRRVAPKARVRPVRTMRTPHSSKATLPSTFIMVATPCMSGNPTPRTALIKPCQLLVRPPQASKQNALDQPDAAHDGDDDRQDLWQARQPAGPRQPDH